MAVSNSWLLAGAYYEASFSVLNKIGNIPWASSCPCSSERQMWRGRGTLVPLALPQPLHWQDLLVPVCPYVLGGQRHGWHWTYCHAHFGQQITQNPSSWGSARFAWGVDTWPQDGGCTNKPSSMRANQGFPSLWMQTPLMCFVHSKLCKVAAVVCRYRTVRLIFKGIWKPHQFWQWKNLATTLLKCQHMDFRHLLHAPQLD